MPSSSDKVKPVPDAIELPTLRYDLAALGCATPPADSLAERGENYIPPTPATTDDASHAELSLEPDAAQFSSLARVDGGFGAWSYVRFCPLIRR